jgi:phosphomethylpyrimidine synthase
MTLIDLARNNELAPRIVKTAEIENVSPEFLRAGLANGTMVIPWAQGHELSRPCAVGDGLSVKINANIGTSPDAGDISGELEKLKAAVDAGAHAVMDLSTGGNLREIRKSIRDACPVSLGSVPMYEAGYMAIDSGRTFRQMTAGDMLKAVRLHVADGVDFITVHCGVTLRAVEYLKKNRRVCGVVSRGGALLARWMVANNQENPLFERFDEVIDICRETDCTLSLGDGLRPGALADAGDRAQIEELYTLGELAARAQKRGVQVIIEGPGHVPFDQIAMQMKLEKRACNNAPFYVLGPLVTDIAPGYDHLVCAIGGTMAAVNGANFLCYVTPAEHLRLPDASDVREGVIATRIAAHAADIANGIPGARDWDDKMSAARKSRDWEKMFELAIDPEFARASRAKAPSAKEDACSMCGDFCALKGEDYF